MEQNNPSVKGFWDFFLALPWQWHLVLAVVGYFVTHALAARDIPLPDQSPEGMALYAHRLVWKTVAWVFQYLLPASFGLASVLSFRRAGNRRRQNT